jgi:hypothetical protein
LAMAIRLFALEPFVYQSADHELSGVSLYGLGDGAPHET